MILKIHVIGIKLEPLSPEIANTIRLGASDSQALKKAYEEVLQELATKFGYEIPAKIKIQKGENSQCQK